jgi:hypothetical protein
MKIEFRLLLAASIVIYSCNNQVQESGGKENEKSADTAASVPSASEATPVLASPYQQQPEYGKLKFTITSPQSASANTFKVEPSGFSTSNDAMTMECEGTVVQSEVGEMDGDNAPELLVVSQSGENKTRKAYVFSSNADNSISMVNLPDFSADAKNMKGYAGHDEFAFVENTFIHRFPLYENGNPLNKTRQLQYKLKPGEAMKQLVLDKMIEY